MFVKLSLLKAEASVETKQSEAESNGLKTLALFSNPAEEMDQWGKNQFLSNLRKRTYRRKS